MSGGDVSLLRGGKTDAARPRPKKDAPGESARKRERERERRAGGKRRPGQHGGIPREGGGNTQGSRREAGETRAGNAFRSSSGQAERRPLSLRHGRSVFFSAALRRALSPAAPAFSGIPAVPGFPDRRQRDARRSHTGRMKREERSAAARPLRNRPSASGGKGAPQPVPEPSAARMKGPGSPPVSGRAARLIPAALPAEKRPEKIPRSAMRPAVKKAPSFSTFLRYCKRPFRKSAPPLFCARKTAAAKYGFNPM